MNNEKVIRKIRIIVWVVTLILGCINIISTLFWFDPVWQIGLCIWILTGTTATLVFDGILKDSDRIFTHAMLYVWFMDVLLINLFQL